MGMDSLSDLKYLIFSDLHGSSGGLDLLRQAIEREKPDVILNLGDVLYGAYDQDANACVDYLSSIHSRVLAVQGNCDFPTDAMRLMTDLRDERTLVVCGHRLYFRHVPFWRDFAVGDIAVNGHTHVKCLYEEGGVYFLNPGSIGKPRDDGPSYALIYQGKLSLADARSGATIKSLPLE